MTVANYHRFLKFFGKLCYSYDLAANDARVQQISRTWEQIGQPADEFANEALMVTFGPYVTQWQNAVSAQNASINVILIAAVKAELISNDFISSIITVNGLAAMANRDKTNPIVIMEAFAAEMGADATTFTTKSSTGLVNFLNAVTGTVPVSFPTNDIPIFPDYLYVTLDLV